MYICISTIFRYLFRTAIFLSVYPAVPSCFEVELVVDNFHESYPRPHFFFTPNLITTKIQITSAMSIVFCFPQVVWGLTRRDVIEVRITAGGRIHHNLRHVISRKSRGILKTHRCWSQTIHNCMMEILWHEI